MSGLKMVTLKDGYTIQESALLTITSNLKDVFKENYVAFYDLVKKCKDPSYRFAINPFADSKAILRTYELIDENDILHDHVRNVVLNSITGTGLSIQLISPIKNEVNPIKNAEYISLKSPYTVTALAVVAVVGGFGIAYLKHLWR